MVQVARYSFTVDEYNRMGAAGIFPDGVRTELIEGEIVEMVPIGSHHASVVVRLSELFYESLRGGQVTVSTQNPLHLSNNSEPEPDLMILDRHRDYYKERHPRPADVRLLIEVSDSTIEWDRDVKLPLYAREGVQEVWIVDLTADVIQVCREPDRGTYAQVRTATRRESVSPFAFPNLAFAVNDILGE